MTREELISSPEYWLTDMQVSLFECAARFMEERGMNRSQLAEHLGVSKSYVTQFLNGNYDHRLSKFVELCLAFGYVPKVLFTPLEDVVLQDLSKADLRRGVTYDGRTDCKHTTLRLNDDCSMSIGLEEKEAA